MLAARALRATCARALPALRSIHQSPVRLLSSEPPQLEDLLDYREVITYSTPQAFVGRPAPRFEAPAVDNMAITDVRLSDWLGQWVVLLFYPKDFTFVCPTELIAFSDRTDEFKALNANVVAISTDTENSHLAWNKMPRSQGGLGHMNIPMVADVTKQISCDYGVLVPEAGIALRGLFIINPEGVLEHITVNNFPVGRSVDETLRLLEAFQFTAKHGEVCPANWTPGEQTMVADPEKSQDYFSSVWDSSKAFGNIRKVTTVEEFHDTLSRNAKVCAFFSASWCGKCNQIAPYIGKLSEKHTDVTFINLDSDKLKGLFSELQIESLPTFRLYENGQQKTQVVGFKKRMVADALNDLKSSI